jgi:hypothetical protein
MRPSRALAAVLAGSVALVLAGVGPAGAGEPAVTVAAFTFHQEGTIPGCGFPVFFSLDGVGRARFFSEQGHSFTNVLQLHQTGTLSANGRTLLVSEHSTKTFFPSRLAPDQQVLLIEHGLSWRFQLPGGRTVSLDAGAYAEFIDGSIVVLGGPHPTIADGDFAELCAALAG